VFNDIRAPNVFFVDMVPTKHALCACVLPGLLGILPFNAALRIPVSSEREQQLRHMQVCRSVIKTRATACAIKIQDCTETARESRVISTENA